MGNESFDSTPGQAQQQLNVEEFATQHGLEEFMGEQFEAHGRVLGFEDIFKCEPAAKMLVALAASLENVPERKEILKQSIRSMASSAEVPIKIEKKTALSPLL
jgi:hypothetical protein